MRRSVHVFLPVVLLITALTGFVPVAAQPSDSTVSVVVSAPSTDGNPYTFSGTYLGHGVVLTDWKAATFYGLGVGDPKLFESPRRRVENYVAPAPGAPPNPEYDAFQSVACLVSG